MVQVVTAINTFFLEQLYYIGVVPGSSLSIPDSIAVEVADKNSLFIGDVSFVMMKGFPYLLYILAIGVGGVIGPDSIKQKFCIVARNGDGDDHPEIGIMFFMNLEAKIAIGKNAKSFVDIGAEP